MEGAEQMEEDGKQNIAEGGEQKAGEMHIPQFVKRSNSKIGRSKTSRTQNLSSDESEGGSSDEEDQPSESDKRAADRLGGSRLDAVLEQQKRREEEDLMTFEKPKHRQRQNAMTGSNSMEIEDEDGKSSGDEEFGDVGEDEVDLYDPDMDDLDQQFVDNRRWRHRPGYSEQSKMAPSRPKGSHSAPAQPFPMPLPSPAGQPTVMHHSMNTHGLVSAHGKGQAGSEDQEGQQRPEHKQDSGQAKQEGESNGNSTQWKTFIAENGYQYWHNEESGESTWEQPEGWKEQAGTQLWKAHVAPSGHEYYYNASTGESTWVKPDGFRGDESAMRGPKYGSDAILSCPCCFTIVCLDCQQHAK